MDYFTAEMNIAEAKMSHYNTVNYFTCTKEIQRMIYYNNPVNWMHHDFLSLTSC